MATAQGPAFGELLKRHRTMAGLTQEELAERAGLSARAVTYLERGARSPYRDTVRRLADALALAPDDRALFEASRLAPAASTPLVIVYAEADAGLAARVAADLAAQGVACRLADTAAHADAPNRDAVRAAQGIILVASLHAARSRRVAERLRVAEMYRRAVYALWVDGESWTEAVPRGYAGMEGIDARRDRYATALRDLVVLLEDSGLGDTAHPRQSSAAHVPGGASRNPYKGLRAFRGADTGDYFGRESLIARVLASLDSADEAPRFRAIVGPSGSGKSSLLLAGVLPRLQHGALPGSDRWLYLEPIVPGTHPLEALTVALGAALPNSSLRAVRDDLDDAPRGLHRLARRLLIGQPGRPAGRVVVVVDQCEELFTLTVDEDERQQFIDVLVTAATEPGGPVLVVLTLRADFYDRPMAYPALGTLLDACSTSILPMSVAELRMTIERPAALPDVQLCFEDDVVGDLLIDAHGQPGALPLLQFALDQLVERREGRLLTVAAYGAIGGARGALTRHAEETYAALPAETHRHLARALFLRLIEPGATEQDTTRRRAALTELDLPDPTQTRLLRTVADAFVAARLLVTGDQAGVAVVEVSHEALIQEWGRLRDWLHEAREDLRRQRAISTDAAEWARRGRPDDYLYRGTALQEAQAWATRNTPSVEEVAFLTAGAVAQERREHIERERQARELTLARGAAAANRRAARRLRALVAALSVFLLAATGLSLVALQARSVALDSARVAAEERTITLSRQLAAQALSHLHDRYDLALLLSVEATRVSATLEARDSLMRGLQINTRLVTILRGHTDEVHSVAFSPDGRTLISGGADNEVRLWDVARARAAGSPLGGHTGTVLAVALSPDGKTLASASVDATIRLWDLSRRPARALGPPLTGHTAAVTSLAFSPNGAILASGSYDGSVRLWDLSRHPARPLGAPLTGHAAEVLAVAFSPDGTLLASGSRDKTIRLWDVTDVMYRPVRPLGPPLGGHTDAVTSLAFSPNGTTLASGSHDKTIRIWRTTRGTARLRAVLAGHSDGVDCVAFGPTGTLLASGGHDATIRLWNLTTGGSFPLTGHAGTVYGLAFSHDGRTLASASADTTVRLWSVTPHAPLQAALLPVGDSVGSVAISPNGATLAAGGLQGEVWLWAVRRGVARALGAPLANGKLLVGSLAFSPHSPRGATLAAGSLDGLRLWDLSRRSQRPLQDAIPATPGGLGYDVTSLAFSPDGITLAAGSVEHSVRLWDVAHGRPVWTEIDDAYGSVMFRPDGRTLIAASPDQSIRFWDVTNRRMRPVGRPLPIQGIAGALALSPSGRVLAVGVDNVIQLWDVSRQPIRSLGTPLSGHTGAITSLAFSPDGTILASAGDDATVRLWDVATGRSYGLPFSGHRFNAASVVFSPDGTAVISGSADKTVRLWDVDVASWRRRACRIANRNLTVAEWRQYLGAEPYHTTCPLAT